MDNSQGAPVLNGGTGVVYSSEEEYVGSSDDDEDFIVPAKYVRITTRSEILSHQIQVPVSYDNSEEVKLDPRLVSEHLYLGTLVHSQPKTLEENSCYELLALHSGIVTFPETILPLVLFSPPLISAMKSVIAGLKVIALIPTLSDSLSEYPTLAPFGTTAEVYEYSVTNPSEPGYRIKARVGKRFKLIRSWTDDHNNLMAQVQILPEETLDPMQPFMFSKNAKSVTQRNLILGEAIQTNSWTKYRNFLDNKSSSVNSLVLLQLDAHALAARLRCQIQNLMAIDDSSMNLVPTEPHSLSFWAANNVLIDDEGRLKLLEEDNVIYRLRTLLDLLNKRHSFSCCVCCSLIADHTDVILTCSQGSNLFFNYPRTGQVKKVMTFENVRNIRVVSRRPSIEFSWFPGYAWSPGECISCHNHLGWYITSGPTQQMKPKSFWVLCSESLKMEISCSSLVGATSEK